MINSESTAGPHDGTAAVLRLVDQYFSHRPGRTFVLPSGDEGLCADHAGGAFNGSQATVVNFTRTSAGKRRALAHMTFLAEWSDKLAPISRIRVTRRTTLTWLATVFLSPPTCWEIPGATRSWVLDSLNWITR
jgi:hypothetical protein